MSNQPSEQGRVIRIGETQTFDSGFQKREIVIETQSDYPQTIPFEVTKDKCDLLDAFKEGDMIEIFYNLRGSYWEKGDRYFPSLSAWRLTKLGSASNDDAQRKEIGDFIKAQPVVDASTDTPDDLPF